MPAIKNKATQITSPDLIKNPHDNFFAQSLTDLTIAKDFLAQYLPQPLFESLDLATLQLCKDRIVDDKLRSSYTDIIYEIKLKDNTQTAYITTLIEHQSTPQVDMPVRVLRYECGLIKRHWDNHKEIPLIFSMVFYNGQEPWHYPTHLKAMINAPAELIERYAFKPFQLVQLANIPDEVLREHLWSGLVSLAMKHIYDRDILPVLEAIMDMLRQAEQHGKPDFSLKILYYIAVANEIHDLEAFNTLVNSHLSPKTGERIMTLVEHYYQKGLKQGLSQAEQYHQKGLEQARLGIARSLFKQGINPAVIAEATGLSIEKIILLVEQEREL